MKRSSGPRKLAGLSDTIYHRLNMYTLAASATGVGLLAVAQPAQARIVYTKTHQVIGLNTKYSLDLNHDRTVDFVLQQIGYCNSTSCFGFQRHLLAKEAPGNAFQGSVGSQGKHLPGDRHPVTGSSAIKIPPLVTNQTGHGIVLD